MSRLRDYVLKNLNSIRIVSFFTYFVGIISYYVFIITGYTNSDGLGEGLYYYSHADFHSENGRWAVRFFNFLFGHNVVMPLIIVLLYCTFVIATVFMVAELLSLRSTFSLVLSSSLMITFPPVVIQMTFANVALTFAGAMFFALFFVFCESLDDRIINLLGVAPLVICFGLYQAYISVISLMTVLIIIVKLLDGIEYKIIGRFALKILLCGIIGTIINTIIYTIDLKVRGLQKSPRLEDFDFGAIIAYFLVDIKRTYINFVNFFVDYSLHRWILYALVFLIVFITVVLLGIKILKEKEYFRLGMVVLLGILIPLFADVITILLPGTMISEIMRYHYVFLIPFALALMERIPVNRVLSKGRIAMQAILIILLSTYIISANATYMSYRISYASIHTQMQAIMDRVFALDGYKLNETDIIMVGFPNDDGGRESGVYDVSYKLPENVASWETSSQFKFDTYFYLMNYMGIDSDWIRDADYERVVSTDEYKNMPIYPKEGSVKMIDGFAVVKLKE